MHFIRELLVRNSTEWIIVSIVIGFWEAENNYSNQFGIDRIFGNKKGVLLYPKLFIVFGFVIVSLSNFAWMFAGPYAPIWGMCRKIIWNYLRT